MCNDTLRRPGQYGVVKRAYDTVLSKQVAIKYVDLYTNEEFGIPTCTVREIAALTRTRENSHVVTLHDIYMTNNHVAIVMELGGSDLWHWLRKNTVFDKFQMSLCLCRAVASLHDVGIVHRDLKPQNILVDGDAGIKIIDFGLCKIEVTGEYCHDTYTTLQTLWYRAPEMLMCHQYPYHTSKIDVWSVACIISHIYCGEPLIAGSTEREQLEKIFGLVGTPDVEGIPQCQGGGIPFSPDMPAPIKTALQCMLQVDPEARCTMHHVLDILSAS